MCLKNQKLCTSVLGKGLADLGQRVRWVVQGLKKDLNLWAGPIFMAHTHLYYLTKQTTI